MQLLETLFTKLLLQFMYNEKKKTAENVTEKQAIARKYNYFQQNSEIKLGLVFINQIITSL